MAAYSALVTFGQLLGQLLDSDQFSHHVPKSELQSFHEKISSLQTSFQTIFPAPKKQREAANILQIEIRDAIYQAQDAVERFIIGKTASLSLKEITEKIDPIIAMAEKLSDSIRTERERWLDGDIPPPPRSGLMKASTMVVGQERDKKLLTQELLNEEDKLQVLPITGMAGIGKTTLARSIYDDPKIKNSFALRAWVTVSQDYHVGDILARLLNSMESLGQKTGERMYQGSDEERRVHLRQSLHNNKFLIVIDDMWDAGVWDKVRNSLPDNKNGSRIILTTRISSVAHNVKSSDFFHHMRPLDEENTWILLCNRVFGGMQQCPPHLEKIGREIAKNCRGLPLSASVIGGLLSQDRQTEEYWRSIAEDTDAAAADGEDSYLELFYLSYNHLPGKLKGCFLYFGAFPKDSDISLSKLTKLWLAEGFLVPSPRHEGLEHVAEEHLLDLTQRNLITVHKLSSDGRIKTCGLHNSLRDLAAQECRKEKFFHSRKKYPQELEEDVQIQRRISVHRNIFMCLEDVYNSTRSITNARSLLYVGPHHHHPLSFCLTFDLLRVLDAFTVYFIDFPHEFLKLIHLRYLSFTYNDDLSPDISRLQNLQVLMVRREPKIIFVGVSFLPDEIWEMPQLRHLWFTETDFPAIPPKFSENRGALLQNLQSLTYINAASCTRDVLQSMPNLRRLGMWVESPGVVGLYLDELEQLEAFKFTVLNPTPNKQVEFQPEIFFPRTLRKLSLSGCGLPWEDMEVIAGLACLEVLKLRDLAFHGEEWCPSYVFETLKFLLIEYLDFKSWIADDSHFPCLEQLILRHCYELEGIPSEIGFIGGLQLIELVDCSYPAVESAEDIKQEQEGFDKRGFQVRIYCSYE
ncbi:hypothetical protein C2S51_010427 [Perilla frutescens var. frutescens]|nr:hypothetical protein C2S51_010427 [Perilla frutescens var. frutescens]